VKEYCRFREIVPRPAFIVLFVFRSLISLNLDSNGLGAEGVEVVAGALRNNSSLTSLSLSFNRAGTVGAEKVAEALNHNKTLTALDFEGNNVKKASVCLVRSALRSSIQVLNLSSNGISDRSGERIARLLAPAGEEAKLSSPSSSSSSAASLPTTVTSEEKEEEEEEEPNGGAPRQLRELLLRSNRIKLRGLMALATATEVWGRKRRRKMMKRAAKAKTSTAATTTTAVIRRNIDEMIGTTPSSVVQGGKKEKGGGGGGNEEAKSSSSTATTTKILTTKQRAPSPTTTIVLVGDKREEIANHDHHPLTLSFEQQPQPSWSQLRVDLQYNTSGPEGIRIIVILELLRYVRLLSLSESVMSYIPENDILRMK